MSDWLMISTEDDYSHTIVYGTYLYMLKENLRPDIVELYRRIKGMEAPFKVLNARAVYQRLEELGATITAWH